MLPIVPPPMLTPPLPHVFISVRRLETINPNLVLPPLSGGKGWKKCTLLCKNADNSTKNTVTNEKPRTRVVRNPFDVPIMKDLTGFQDSYDALLPSTSTDPQHIVGFQVNPELQEQQNKQQKVERKASNAPIDLRDVSNQKKTEKQD